MTTRQERFAQSCGEARRLIPEVGSLAGFREPTRSGYESLAGLPGHGTLGLFLMEPYQPQSGWTFVAGAPLLQMVCENGMPTAGAQGSAASAVVELGAADVPEMVELTTLTKPGPFNQRTHELGIYLGIRREGRLVAMAGERLKVPGFTEVSAVCTHPEHTGHGYAGLLMTEVIRRMRGREETPFLHVREDNLRAVELYQRLGFTTRTQVHLAVLRRQ